MELGQDAPEAPEVRPVEPTGVDLVRRDDSHGHPGRAPEHRVVEALALGRVDLLGVVEERERPDAVTPERLVVEQHAGDDEGSCE